MWYVILYFTRSRRAKMRSGNGVEFLVETNRRNSLEFVAQQEKRRLYRKEHPTEISLEKCGDGRLNGNVWTETPLGVFKPFRNIGGIFKLGWPHFQDVIQADKEYADLKGRDSLNICTYHYSRGSKNRGCAGHYYDKEAAMDCSLQLKHEFDRIYWGRDVNGPTRLFAIQAGFETDWESLIFHGEDGQPVDLATVTDDSEGDIRNLLASLYPKIHRLSPNVINDMIPLVQGNIRHSQKIRNSNRPLQDLDHREFVVAVGRGFDWLHLSNTAVIVGPWQLPDPAPIITAFDLLTKNLKAELIEVPVLLTSGVYNSAPENKSWPERKGLAIVKSLELRRFTLEVIQRKHAELLPTLQVLTTIVDLNTRKLEVIA